MRTVEGAKYLGWLPSSACTGSFPPSLSHRYLLPSFSHLCIIFFAWFLTAIILFCCPWIYHYFWIKVVVSSLRSMEPFLTLKLSLHSIMLNSYFVIHVAERLNNILTHSEYNFKLAGSFEISNCWFMLIYLICTYLKVVTNEKWGGSKSWQVFEGCTGPWW
jgi:hypothetical protein